MKIIFHIKLALVKIVESWLLLSSQKRLHPDQKANTPQITAGASLCFPSAIALSFLSIGSEKVWGFHLCSTSWSTLTWGLSSHRRPKLPWRTRNLPKIKRLKARWPPMEDTEESTTGSFGYETHNLTLSNASKFSCSLFQAANPTFFFPNLSRPSATSLITYNHQPEQEPYYS